MKLREIHLQRFKSIDGREGQSIVLGDVTVLLGANGSGNTGNDNPKLCSIIRILPADQPNATSGTLP